MFKGLITAGLAVGVVATGSPVHAANCGLREFVVEKLATKYSEQLTVGGLQMSQSEQTVMEIWSSAETGTYTVLLTNPQGVSCVVAAGTDFFKAEPQQPVDGTAS